MNEIEGKTTRPFAVLYPTDSIVRASNDYSSLEVDLDENQNLVVLNFGTDADTTGASVAFDARDLRLFIIVLTAALAEVEAKP